MNSGHDVCEENELGLIVCVWQLASFEGVECGTDNQEERIGQSSHNTKVSIILFLRSERLELKLLHYLTPTPPQMRILLPFEAISRVVGGSTISHNVLMTISTRISKTAIIVEDIGLVKRGLAPVKRNSSVKKKCIGRFNLVFFLFTSIEYARQSVHFCDNCCITY